MTPPLAPPAVSTPQPHLFCIRRGRERVKLTDFQAGLRYMEFTEAVARAAQSGRTVALPLLD